MAKKSKDVQFFEAIGKRKEAAALVRLYIPGADKVVSVNGTKIKQGEIFVNKKPVSQFFSQPQEKAKYLRALKLTGSEERYAISIIVKGGGKNGQLDAVVHGLSRALDKVDHDTYHPLLKKEKLLTRDPRARQRRRVGTGGKSRRQKQSPKR